MNCLAGNTFESIHLESSNIRKNFTYVTETITTNQISKDQYHIEKPEFTKKI